MRYHCSVIEREHWYKLPCDKPAHLIYVDDDQVRHGFCVEHTARGLTERARKGWSLDLPTVEGAA